MAERAKQRSLSFRREGSAMKVSLYLPNVPISDGVRAKNPKGRMSIVRFSLDEFPLNPVERDKTTWKARVRDPKRWVAKTLR